MKHPCADDNLGLTEAELAGLTGFTWPMMRMVAHVREAWDHADTGNRSAIVSGLLVMIDEGHSFKRNKRIIAKVLSAGLDENERAHLLGLLNLHGEAPVPRVE